MASAVLMAVTTYVRAAAERDPVVRGELLESCFAESCRFVTRSSVITGRAGIDAMIARGLADPNILGFRLASVIDAAGTTFRFRTLVDRREGAPLEFFDAGEIDAEGRIATIFSFAGPLADAPA
jgi:hypothetical protein